MPHFTTRQWNVIIGDVAVLVLLTVVGFATHLTMDAFGRMLVTAVGALAAWAAVAPFLGVYRENVIEDPRVGVAGGVGGSRGSSNGNVPSRGDVGSRHTLGVRAGDDPHHQLCPGCVAHRLRLVVRSQVLKRLNIGQ